MQRTSLHKEIVHLYEKLQSTTVYREHVKKSGISLASSKWNGFAHLTADRNTGQDELVQRRKRIGGRLNRIQRKNSLGAALPWVKTIGAGSRTAGEGPAKDAADSVKVAIARSEVTNLSGCT